MLTHNIHAPGIDADDIDKRVFSQGHRTHTGESVSFLAAITVMTPLPAIAHTNALRALGT